MLSPPTHPSPAPALSRSSMRGLTLLLSLSLLLCTFSSASAVVTPFGERVNEAINRGLTWLRQNQNGDGGWGRPTGLAVLCFLEQRAGADWNAPALGYVGMDPGDQQITRSGVKYCIDDVSSFRAGSQARSYDTGACMMAMSSSKQLRLIF